jgi:hypothetical protein
VKNDREPVALYHLATDIGESKNLAGKEPGRVAAMKRIYDEWDAQNMEPLWTERRPGVTADAPAPRAPGSDPSQVAAYYFPNWGPHQTISK